MPAKISEMVQEIITLITALPELTDKGFSVYNLEDTEASIKLMSARLPIVCIGYEGTFPVDQGTGSSACKGNAALVESRYSVVLALEYAGSEAAVQTKDIATDLLDAVRAVVLGYTGVSNRPWRFLSESPIDGELEGVIYYGQLWGTTVPIVSTN